MFEKFSLVEDLIAEMVERYRTTHERALGEIRAGQKQSCWSWWVWPTNYRPGSSGMSLKYALSDTDAVHFLGDEYLHTCWMEIMTSVAEQVESGVSLKRLSLG